MPSCCHLDNSLSHILDHLLTYKAMVFYLVSVFIHKEGYFSLKRPGLKIENLRYSITFLSEYYMIFEGNFERNCQEKIQGFFWCGRQNDFTQYFTFKVFCIYSK